MADEEKQEQQQKAKGDSRAVARDEDLQPTWTDKEGNVHRKRILTGDRTTGKLHLGHYVGSLKNRVKLQKQYDTFVLMADIQALTTHWEDPKILRQSVRDVALDYLAVGIDPYTGGEDDGTKTKIVIQSAVPAIAELTILYGLFMPIRTLVDNPTTKAEAQQYGYSLEDASEIQYRQKLQNNSTLAQSVESAAEELSAEFVGVDDLSPIELLKAVETVSNSSNSVTQAELKYVIELSRYQSQKEKLESSKSRLMSMLDADSSIVTSTAANQLRNLQLHDVSYKHSSMINSVIDEFESVTKAQELLATVLGEWKSHTKNYSSFANEFTSVADSIRDQISVTIPNLHQQGLKAKLAALESSLDDLQEPEVPEHRIEAKNEEEAITDEQINEKRNFELTYEALLKSQMLQKELRESVISLRRKKGFYAMPYGFLGYPVSQAADITFVNAHLVPVGVDQVPHIELTRDIVQRFNRQYGKRRRVLVEPQALVGGGGTLKGIDGNAKMSKSLGNAIYLSDTPDEMWRKIKPAPTDPQRIRKTDPGRPEVCNIFSYHQTFCQASEPAIVESDLGVATVEEVAANCRGAKWGCVECKQHLHKKITALTDPMRERRAYWEQHEDDMIDILKLGTQRGCEEGEQTLERVKDAMKLNYWD